MLFVAIAWVYVVLMMAITERSAVAGVMTFLLYGVLPVSVILYISGSSARKRRRLARMDKPAKAASDDEAGPSQEESSS